MDDLQAERERRAQRAFKHTTRHVTMSACPVERVEVRAVLAAVEAGVIDRAAAHEACPPRW